MAEKKNTYGASSITVLEGLEAVRKRPGMYIGSTGPRGLHHLIWEVVDNAVDEAMAGYASRVQVTLREDGGITVVDDGRGIPVGMHPVEKKPAVEMVMTMLHAGGKFDSDSYAVSGGLHGVGISVVNALSTALDVEINTDGFEWSQHYTRSVPGPLHKGAATTKTGTTVTYWADPDIFESTDYDLETIRRRLQEMAFLNKGLTLTLHRRARPRGRGRGRRRRSSPTPRASSPSAKVHVYHYPNGLASPTSSKYLNTSRRARSHQHVIHVENEDEERRISRSRSRCSGTTAYSESVYTFANTINTHRGRHARGRVSAAALTTLGQQVTRASANILKEKDTNLSGEDIREGLVAIVSVKLKRAAVRGSDQGQARQHRGQDLRPEAESTSGWPTGSSANPTEGKEIDHQGGAGGVGPARSPRARPASWCAARTRSGDHRGLPGKLIDCRST